MADLWVCNCFVVGGGGVGGGFFLSCFFVSFVGSSPLPLLCCFVLFALSVTAMCCTTELYWVVTGECVREGKEKLGEHHREEVLSGIISHRGSENLWNFCQLLIKSRELLSWKRTVFLLSGSGLVQQVEDISEETYPILFPTQLTIRVRKLADVTWSLHLGSQEDRNSPTTAYPSVPGVIVSVFRYPVTLSILFYRGKT